MSRSPRLRSTVVAGVLLVTAVPLVAGATAPHLTCAPTPVGRWETIRVQSFTPISGISASDHDVVETYSLARTKPQDVAVTNGYTVLLSHTHGCAWSKVFELNPTVSGSQSFVGAQSHIVSVALAGGIAMAAVQEGTGSASRPHILLSSKAGTPGSWASSDNGLPAQGAPRLLKSAGDGRTFYLTVSPTATGGSGGGSTGIIPGGLPGGPTDTPTGFLYRTVDGGANWTLQTGAADLPGGGTGFSQLDIDPGNSNALYGIVGGRLLTSRDGGGTFTAVSGSGYTAVTAGAPGEVLGFSGGGGVRSLNGGATFTSFVAPSGVTSAASRNGNSDILVELSGKFYELEPGANAKTAVFAKTLGRAGTLLGDRSNQSSFHALSGHSLLRYVDPVTPGVEIPPLPVGDNRVPPPNPGTVSPRAVNITLPIGSATTQDFVLDLPKNPTPLDLFFLVDISTSMGPFIADLQTNIRNIVRTLEAAKIDLRVGVGTVGTGPIYNEQPYPDAYVFPPASDPNNPGGPPVSKPYTKPTLYNRLRAVGQPDADLTTAINRLKLETPPPGASNSEGQLLALKNLTNGGGTRTQVEATAKSPFISAIAPNQDAGWRSQPDVRRIVILATNEYFQAPFGGEPDVQSYLPGASAQTSTPQNPELDFAPTIAMLNAARTKVIGLTAGQIEAQADLQKLAAGTHMFAPPGGVSCGGEPVQELAAGDPLVCNNGDGFSAVIQRVLSTLVDRQAVKVVPHVRTPVLGAIDASKLQALDVKQPNRVSFRVGLTCIDVKPGIYPQDVDLILRDSIVGRARINVSCVKAAALARPRPLLADPPVNPPPGAAPNPPPPPAPAPPAVQPQAQPQVQTQVQIQPLTAGAVQEQQELQLALALNGTLKDDDPVFNAGQQMAMVDRRKREEVQALGVLAFAVVTCAGLGLAGLRARPELKVRRAH